MSRADEPIRVLFVCTHNSARSQIAEALLGHAGGDDFQVRSAGTEATRVNPLAIRALADRGIDWSGAESKGLAQFVGQPWDYVITVCDGAREACPVFPGAARSLHWSLDDPSEVKGADEVRLAAFRATVAEVAARLRPFIETALRDAGRTALVPGSPRPDSAVMSAPAQPGRLTRRERIGLLIHRQLDRRMSRFGVWLMRRTRGSLADRYRVQALVLSTVGRKTGRSREVVLQYFADGDAFVVVATNDGGATDPAWYLNLMAAGRAEVEVRGQRTAVTPVRLEGEAASEWWGRILELAPDYERYARATARTFPLVRLVPTQRSR